MIRISKPRIEKNDNTTFLLSEVYDEVRNLRMDVWFSVDSIWGEYLCNEYADSFLLLLLPIAMKSRQGITIDCPVSSKLFFNIQNTIQPLFCKILEVDSPIVIKAEVNNSVCFESKGVGCGCSLGVDSLSSFFKHFGEEAMSGYEVTHLTLFNSGQLGDYDLDASEKNFHRSVEELKPFSAAVNLPILAVNSNLNEFYKYSGVSLLQSFINRTLACAMAVQKLLGKYVYASSYMISQFEISTIDQSHCESSYVPLFSTHNFETILSNPMLSRVDKTEFISKNALTPKFLQVCWAEQTAYEVWHNTRFLEGKTKTNCGWCDKCLRTLLTLEVIQNGNIDMYADKFELKKYYEHREDYIKKVFKERKSNFFYQEIVELILQRNYPIASSVKRHYEWELLKERFSSVIIKTTNRIAVMPMRILHKIKSKIQNK